MTPDTLSTAEGGSAQTFTVRLAVQPGADVEIDIGSNDPTEGTVSPTILWFGPTARTVVVGRTPRNISRWDDARTVTVRPKDDTVAGLAQEYTITLDAGSVDDSGIVQDAYYDNDDAGVPNRTVTVTNADNDLGLVLSKTALATAEDGSADSFTVQMSTRPSAPVTVEIALDGTEGAAAPGALTCDGSTWNTARTVAVTGQDDTLDDSNVRYTLTLTPSSTDTDYDGSAKAATLTVDNNDDDLVPTLRLTPATIAESGTGNVTTVTATLNRTRIAPTTVTVSVPADAGATVSANAALTIAPGATTSTGTVTVTAVGDGTDAPDKTVRVSGTSSAGVGHPRDVTLTITDDDAAPSLSISSPSLDEGDSGQRTMPLTVTLSAASGWEVTVGYGLDGTDGGTATAGADYTAIVPGTLTFPAGTTSRSISVLVTAIPSTSRTRRSG